MSTNSYAMKMAVFSAITVSVHSIERRRIKGSIEFEKDGKKSSFDLIFTYSEDIKADNNMAGLILTMPAINFAYFSRELILNFEVEEPDEKIIREWVTINNREVFINHICRRRYEFFKEPYIPKENDITPENSVGITKISFPKRRKTMGLTGTDHDGVGIMSSGGKESLLSSGIFSEIGVNPLHIFYNESGAHWLPAKTAHDNMKESGKRVAKVWSNTDRFYKFGLRLLPQIDMDVVAKKADSYPIQAFIFPVYIMALLPLAIREGIGNLIMGDEFDDPLEMEDFHGIQHFYGVYDQSNLFNSRISDYFKEKLLGISVWSAVYPINGSVEERILIQRYPGLFSLQRSCHSCRKVGDAIIPCGVCSKCLGILLFVLAAGGNPKLIGYREQHIQDLQKNLALTSLRLDRDELELMKRKVFHNDHSTVSHVEMVHIIPGESGPFSMIPEEFRGKIANIITPYTSGTCSVVQGKWKPICRDQKNRDSAAFTSS